MRQSRRAPVPDICNRTPGLCHYTAHRTCWLIRRDTSNNADDNGTNIINDSPRSESYSHSSVIRKNGLLISLTEKVIGTEAAGWQKIFDNTDHCADSGPAR